MFSVIIPIFNKRPHLDRSINSVLTQTFNDWEIIIVDDGSTDGSREYLLDNYKNNHKIRIFLRNVPGPGGYKARNYAISKAKYEWIAFLDADDEWTPTKLSDMCNLSKKFPDCEFLSSAWIEVNAEIQRFDDYFKINQRRESHEFNLKLFLKNKQPVWTSVVIVKKYLIINLNGFNENWKMGADLDLWFRILLFGAKGAWLNKVTAFYYLDSVNMVTRKTIFYKSPVVETIKNYLENNIKKDLILEKNLKKYSNRITLYTIKKRIRRRIDFYELIYSDFFYSPLLLNKVYFKTIFFLIAPKKVIYYLVDKKII
jgi:succinoglycan biosynthesis protein ExoO